MQILIDLGALTIFGLGVATGVGGGFALLMAALYAFATRFKVPGSPN